ncbi:Piso0_001591 [Millerozyma farinosa CBS 7064]|uniref:Piso0_001591 protein n=1 Tax=Pichia sorbitophila (strain ATCC MYA-4447 / BCRC 22081 / CBS 7064 / NBRC 10061 / NRRL Y-12695) TaxID=559304 RepID=G8YNK3_PICSO|nr:Piso0_001591 [Millerozyma farinosa CBS 7064]
MIDDRTSMIDDTKYSNTEGASLETTDSSNERGEPELKRNLKNRHISLIALAGIIGPGILIGASLAIKNGAASFLISCVVIGLVAFCMLQALGELSTLYPTGGAFSTLGNKFVDPAFGGTVGWNYVIVWIAVLANEYNAVASILQFWGPQVPLYGYILIFWVAFLAFQFLGVKTFGEAEYWLALMKIVGLLAFYIFTIVYISGGVKGTPAFGFHYWRIGAFNHNFKGLANTFVFTSTFFSGTESIAITAAESRNPSKAVPSAVRQTFWRILFIYIGVALSYGLTVPYNDPLLNNGTKALQSPMSIALIRAGWASGPHLINAFILVTCISAINSSIYIGSRTIVNLAAENAAPKVLGKVNKQGVPYMAVIFTNALGLISLMNISTGAATAYSYIVNLSGVAVFIVWGSICFIQIRFRNACKIQGRDTEHLPYRAFLYPWITIIGLVACIFLGLIQGWSYFKPFDVKNFVDAYILLPFFVVLFIYLKLMNKTKWVDLKTVDLDEGRRTDLDQPTTEKKFTSIFSK